MRLNKLCLTNFRSYTRLETEIPAGILLLSGGNAQGKTSLLESLFYCATFSPILAQNDRQIIHFEAQREALAVARITIDFERDHADHQLEVRIIQEPNGKNGRIRKEILLNGQKIRAQKAVGKFPAVLFVPQMTAIIEGAPVERRRYLNIFLSQSVPDYAQALTEHKQVLQQRNALLKQIAEGRTDTGQLDYWDEMLISRASLITYHRAQALRALQQYAAENHIDLTARQEALSMVYEPALGLSGQAAIELNGSESQPEISEQISAGLKTARPAEISRGVTLIGPHRDEFRILANGIDLNRFGSRGQIRTALLSLKFAEIRWVTEHAGAEPILLLDETLAELDEQRRADLMKRLDECRQGILTTTDLAHFSEAFTERHTVWTVQNGMLCKP